MIELKKNKSNRRKTRKRGEIHKRTRKRQKTDKRKYFPSNKAKTTKEKKENVSPLLVPWSVNDIYCTRKVLSIK